MSGPIVCCGEAGLFPSSFCCGNGCCRQNWPEFLFFPTSFWLLPLVSFPYIFTSSLALFFSFFDLPLAMAERTSAGCLFQYTLCMACPHLVKPHLLFHFSPPHHTMFQSLFLHISFQSLITFQPNALQFHHLPSPVPLLFPFTFHVLWDLDSFGPFFF